MWSRCSNYLKGGAPPPPKSKGKDQSCALDETVEIGSSDYLLAPRTSSDHARKPKIARDSKETSFDNPFTDPANIVAGQPSVEWKDSPASAKAQSKPPQHSSSQHWPSKGHTTERSDGAKSGQMDTEKSAAQSYGSIRLAAQARLMERGRRERQRLEQDKVDRLANRC